MRRVASLAVLALVVGLAGAACGYQGTTKALPSSVDGKPVNQTTTTGSGSTTTTTTTTTATAGATTSTTGGGAAVGDVAAGKAVFTSAGCGGCHTLKDAGSTGTVGPNLDDLKPDAGRVAKQVTNGGAVMPAFKGSLSPKQILDVAAYVSSVAGQ